MHPLMDGCMHFIWVHLIWMHLIWVHLICVHLKEDVVYVMQLVRCHLLIVDGAVLGEVLVLAACPAQQNHHRLLCLLPVSL